tara:strand:- start:57 stop:272 length:216 start_codon:yes stop_codon:yes gene_type:complete
MAISGTRKLNTRLNSDRRIAESVARSAHIPAGNTKEQTATEIKNILGIEGEAVGTLNTQELHSKTLNGGFF